MAAAVAVVVLVVEEEQERVWGMVGSLNCSIEWAKKQTEREHAAPSLHKVVLYFNGWR